MNDTETNLYTKLKKSYSELFNKFNKREQIIILNQELEKAVNQFNDKADELKKLKDENEKLKDHIIKINKMKNYYKKIVDHNMNYIILTECDYFGNPLN
jgi:cell shape-determining protein MreC